MSRLNPASQGAVVLLAARYRTEAALALSLRLSLPFAVAALAFTAHATLADPMIRVPAGSFLMGESTALCGDDPRPVTLTRDFELSATEVTNADYLAALEWAREQGRVIVNGGRVLDVASGQTLLDLGSWYAEIQFDGAHFFLRQAPYALAGAYPGGYDPASHPVIKVSWYGAAAFCNWRSERDALPPAYDPVTFVCNGGDPYSARGYRLPMDAEWEYAAQFPDERIHPWGETAADCTLANHNPGSGYCVGWTSPVGSHPEGASALGFVDMGGNVGEWTNDWWSCERSTAPAVDPISPHEGTKITLHGGGWFYGEVYTHCASRDADDPHFTYEGQGFRIARTAPASASIVASADLALPRLLSNPLRRGEPVRLALPSFRQDRVRLTLFDASGRSVTRPTEVQASAERVLAWRTDARLPAGVYRLRVEARGARAVAIPLVLVE